MSVKITEDFVKFIWQHKLFSTDITTVSNEPVKVNDTGQANIDAGPDYFCANLLIGNINIVGNVEIHVKSSDFIKHKHQHDQAYSNIILHVVYENDLPLDFPTLELKNFISDKTVETYVQLLYKKNDLACNTLLHSLPEINKMLWLEACGAERLIDKMTSVEEVLKNYGNDWDATFYFFLFRNFGFNLNSEGFEQLFKTLHVSLLLKYSENWLQLLALLLGQAGIIEKADLPESIKAVLKKEYDYLKNKHELQPLDNTVWKFLRTRPANFPTVRVIQLAYIIHKHQRVFSKIKEVDAVKDYIKLFETSGLKKISGFEKVPVPTEASLYIVLTNTVAPVLFAYGRSNQQEVYADKALALLENIKPEENKYTRMYTAYNVNAVNALQSQGNIHLYKNYCKPRNCLKCSWGNHFLRK